jgi:AcrR family transcriptional regulator
MINQSRQDKHKNICRNRRERERTQRIQSIQEAAKRVFSRKGYKKATMNEIALEAEITKPTIYLYYKTKDDLFFALVVPLIEDMRRKLENTEAKLDNGEEIRSGKQLITEVFRAFYDGFESYPTAFRIIQLQQQDLIGESCSDILADLKKKCTTILSSPGGFWPKALCLDC